MQITKGTVFVGPDRWPARSDKSGNLIVQVGELYTCVIEAETIELLIRHQITQTLEGVGRERDAAQRG